MTKFVIQTYYNEALAENWQYISANLRRYERAMEKASRRYDGVLSYMYHNNKRALLKLLSLGINVDEEDSIGNTVLITAAGIGDLRIVEALCVNGANVNHRNKSHETALSFASVYGHVSVVKRLLKHGADPNITFDDGESLENSCNLLPTIRRTIRTAIKRHEKS